MEKKLVCHTRTEKGKNAAGRIRRAGLIPGNLIKNGVSYPLTFDEPNFNKLLNTGLRQSTIIDLDVEDGEKGNRVIIKEIQRDPVTGVILHVDFYTVTPGQKVAVSISVETEGLSKGVKAGGALEHFIRLLKVKATPETLQDVIKVDISNLDVGDAIHLKDLNLPADWDLKLEGNPIICKISRGRMAKQTAGAGEEQAAAAS